MLSDANFRIGYQWARSVYRGVGDLDKAKKIIGDIGLNKTQDDYDRGVRAYVEEMEKIENKSNETKEERPMDAILTCDKPSEGFDSSPKNSADSAFQYLIQWRADDTYFSDYTLCASMDEVVKEAMEGCSGMAIGIGENGQDTLELSRGRLEGMLAYSIMSCKRVVGYELEPEGEGDDPDPRPIFQIDVI